MPIQKEFKNISVILFALVLLALSIFIVFPVVQPVIIGLLLAYLFNPLYRKILKFTKEKNLAAFVIILIILLGVALPLWFLFPLILRQAFDMYLYLQKVDIGAILNRILPSLITTDFSKELVLSMNKFISSTANKFFSSATSSLINLPILFLKVTISFFVLFFGLRDEENIRNSLKSFSPFDKEMELKLTKNFNGVTKSVIYGYIFIGILQGVLTGIGLIIFGSPQPLFLTLIAIFGAVIPVLGAWIVWLPVCVYLFLTGHTGAAIGLFLWGAILVSWIDNILRPYIVSKKSNVSTATVFIGMMGGLISMGVIGLLLGPLILSYLLLLLESYKSEKEENKKGEN
jgi:predicted PurR-regulated permease PerM